MYHCSHETQCIIVYALQLGLVSIPFYAIPIATSTIFRIFSFTCILMYLGQLWFRTNFIHSRSEALPCFTYHVHVATPSGQLSQKHTLLDIWTIHSFEISMKLKGGWRLYELLFMYTYPELSGCMGYDLHHNAGGGNQWISLNTMAEAWCALFRTIHSLGACSRLWTATWVTPFVLIDLVPALPHGSTPTQLMSTASSNMCSVLQPLACCSAAQCS